MRGHRTGENPARWKGHLEALLPAPTKVHRVEHYAALPYDQIGIFLADLRKRGNVSARALEFCILTATHTGETLKAQWEEIDLGNAMWTIPATRTKTGKAHRVPLSAPALAILNDMATIRTGDFVFPGIKTDKPMSRTVLLERLEHMGRTDLTVHGFRSTFRDWAAECTNFPREVAEMCLAHTIGNQVEAAYRRGDLFEKRRQVMDAWARYCEAPAIENAHNVVSLQQFAGA